jgi:hypothetical protein
MSQVSLLTVVRGIATFIPGVRALATRSTRGTSSASYCYSVWLRHLVLAHRSGAAWPVKTVAELGPCDSIGIGLAAVLSGATYYVGLDAYPYAGNTSNLDIFEELVQLFRARTPIPDAEEFPGVWPVLGSYEFPAGILTDQVLTESLAPERLEISRKSLRSGLKFEQDGSGAISLRYAAPWFTKDLLREGSVDMVFSQAVMEHVRDVEATYTLLRKWLKPGGMMSHSIDYSSHGYTHDWNGHWTVSGPLWWVVAGNRKFCINRFPHNEHRKAMQSAGFRLIHESVCSGKVLERSHLAAEFRQISEVDLGSKGVFVQAIAG